MSNEAIDEDLLANYEVETFTYHYDDKESISVSVQSATSTRGSNLITDDRDRTGIMIWPATHLMCQSTITMTNCSSTMLGKTVLELGVGVGLVGVTACKAHQRQTAFSNNDDPQKLLWVSTDADDKALELCRKNYQFNGIPDDLYWVKNLRWGDAVQMKRLSEDLEAVSGSAKFDSVVAADIIYPATCGHDLKDLLETVDFLLKKPGGVFWLAFCARDGCKTPKRLIEAASEASFRITAAPPIDAEIKAKLPPLLDAVLLKLEKSPTARQHNETLGEDDCVAFPRLKDLIHREENEAWGSDEEWMPPFESNEDV